MFIAIALICAAVVTLADLIWITKEKTAKEVIRVILRNMTSIPLLCIAVQKNVLHYAHFIDTKRYHTHQYIVFLVTALIVSVVIELFFAIVNEKIGFRKCEEPKHKKRTVALKIVAVIVFFLGCAAFFGTVWGLEAFGHVTGDQLIINLTSPTEGTERSVYIDGFEGPVFNTLLATVLFSVIIFAKVNVVYIIKDKIKVIFSEHFKRIVCALLAVVCLVSGVAYGYKGFRLQQVYNAYVVKSSFIEDNYVNPKTAKITFPEKKRNLIHIYLESMEVSYLSKDLGGFMDENLMPKLTKLSEQGIIFSDSDRKFGGPYEGTGTSWSIASMVNQTMGIPMKAPGMHNAYGADGNFLPGAYSLGEMLEKEGYEQSVMFGSSAQFGGLEYLYKCHGNWTIMDYYYIKSRGKLPKPDYKVWWGFEDDKLYKFAKEELTRMYNTGKPFNFTMETADTHRPGGYITPGKKKPYENHYASAIWNSDKDVCEFIEWIMEQPFYENTTIVLIGDHQSMETKFFKEYGFTKDYERKQFNLILNPDPSVANIDEKLTRNRKWANWDLYPTIISSIGGKIEGERLGIGTNLFSGKKTIFEESDVDAVNDELEKGSDFYNETILGGKGMQAARSRNNKHVAKDHTQSPDK